MENLLVASDTSIQSFSDMTIGEQLITPFQPVNIQRRLGPYGRMLDLEPAIPKAPGPEFLVRLLTGHASHQAYIRHSAGSQYKNLENLIRRKHKVSPTTKLVLASCLGLPVEDLENLCGSAPEGPLIPGILAIFQAVEGLPTRVTSWLLDREVPCSCCGNNLLDDANAWWSEHAPGMRAAEYQLSERLLNALLGAGLIEQFVASLQKREERSLDRLDALANPSRHPIGNWLNEAQAAMSCGSFAELAAAMQLRGDAGITFSHGRLKKWSAGQDVMPLEAGEAIAESCGQAQGGLLRFLAARTIAVVTDFVAASLPIATNVVGRKGAQEIVNSRLEQLRGNHQIAIAAAAGRLPQHSMSRKPIVATSN